MEKIYDRDNHTSGYLNKHIIYDKHHHIMGYIDKCNIYDRSKRLVGYERDNMIFNCCSCPVGHFDGYTVLDGRNQVIGHVNSSHNALLAAAGILLILGSFTSRRRFY